MKAVILRVDSPGGEVLASDEIYEAIRHFQSDTEIPVVASMGSLAASGLLRQHSMPLDRSPSPSLTGSIGSSSTATIIGDSMDKVGVRPDVVKSGKTQ